jgi:hypothetical protein
MADRVWLSPKQAHEKYGPSVPTWRNWIYQQKVESMHLGRRVFINEDSIRRLIEQNTTHAR